MTGLTDDCTCPEAWLRREGRHQEACPEHRPLALTTQHRAVFSYPSSILGKTADTYGPWRDTLADAAKDRVPRSEETLGWRSGFQRRAVTPTQPEKVYIEIDAVPFMSNPGATDEDKEWARALHGVWFDVDDLHEARPDTRGRFTTQRTGQIVYRPSDLAPAEVVALRADWNRR
jgi:hypothetical protein